MRRILPLKDQNLPINQTKYFWLQLWFRTQKRRLCAVIIIQSSSDRIIKDACVTRATQIALCVDGEEVECSRQDALLQGVITAFVSIFNQMLCSFFFFFSLLPPIIHHATYENKCCYSPCPLPWLRVFHVITVIITVCQFLHKIHKDGLSVQLQSTSARFFFFFKACSKSTRQASYF